MKLFNFLQKKSNTKNASFHQLRNFVTIAFMFISCCLFSQTTVAFNYTGAMQTWTVPAGVNSVYLQAWGAQGGTGEGLSAYGGFGGMAEGDFPVVPGVTLYIYVGEQGQTTTTQNTLEGGGWNGGGNARGGVGIARGGGGGASDVRVGGTTLIDRVLIGGGGGGTCTSDTRGGNGGGYMGIGGAGGGANGATQSSGGSNQSGSNCEAGVLGLGGSSSLSSTCAGGGSGYIGGLINGVHTTGIRSGHGMVRITYSAISNDLCPNPIEVFCDDVITGSTVGAGPDNPACSGTSNTGGGLWYFFTGLGEDVTISTCNPGTDFDTQISVFAGSCNEPICVASNDNIAGCGDQSNLTFFAAAGGFYRILIDGPNGAEGNFELSVFCGCPQFTLDCLANVYLDCNNPFPVAAATTIAEFEAQGGTVDGGTCGTSSFSISHIDIDYGCNSLALVNLERQYTITNIFTGQMETCSQVFFCPTYPFFEANCPANAILECHESIPPAATNAMEWMNQGGFLTAGPCDPSYSITHVDNSNNTGFCSDLLINRVYTVTIIETGQAITCEQDITRHSAPAPTIASNGPITIECTQELFNMNLEDLVTVSHPNSGCDPFYSIGHSDIPDGYDCNGHQYTMEFEVTDECGRKNTTDQIINIVNSGLQISCPADRVVSCYDDIVSELNQVQVISPCGMSFSKDDDFPVLIEGEYGCSGAIYSITYLAENDCGEEVECEQFFTIQNDGLQLTCPADQIVTCFDEINFDPSQVQILSLIHI